MWLPLAALLLGAAPGQDSPEALFKHMEQPILKCKTLQIQLEIAARPGKEIAIGPGRNITLKGRLLAAGGNKMRLELDGTFGDKPTKMVMVSDGAKARTTGAGFPGRVQETPKHLSETILASVTRTGVFVPMFLAIEAEEPEKKPEDFDIDRQFSVSDIKLGKREPVSGKEAQALEYQLATKGAKKPLAVAVWIDVKTDLPVKRVVTGMEGKETITVTEMYTQVVLDEKIDDKEFELPK